MKKVLLFFALLSLSLPIAAQSKSKANKDTKQWRYDLECAGTGAEGTALVKVWTYSKKSATAANQAVKNAVHGVIFKGTANGENCRGQRPLARNAGVEQEKADYFKAFFADGGEYRKYGSAIGVPETIKIGSEYKVGVVVSVQKDQLRKALEEAGIIKSLGAGF